MNPEILAQFMQDKALSINEIGRKSSIAPSNLSRILRGMTNLTDDMVKRLSSAYPALLEYITNDERAEIERRPLKRRYLTEDTQEGGLFFKLLVPEMRKQFNARAPQNYEFLPEYSITQDLADRRNNETMLVLQVMETDLGPRVLPGDLVRAVEIPAEEWAYAQGLVFIVYAGYAVIKRIARNNITDRDGTLELEQGENRITVPYFQIKQLMQVDKILRGNLSI